MPTALIVLADGFEEMEAVAPIDLLRRAEVDVTVAGVPECSLTGRNGIKLTTDTTLAELLDRKFDLIVLAGGPAFKRLRVEAPLLKLLREHEAAGAKIAAICAAPTVLKEAGLLEDRAFTAHFSVREELPEFDPDRLVIEDRGVTTSQGAGTATPFALAIVAQLCAQEVADDIAAAICFPR